MALPAVAIGIVTSYFKLPTLPLGYLSYAFSFQVVISASAEAGEPIEGMVPNAVAREIEVAGLYR